MTPDAWPQPNITRLEAAARGLYIAEWTLGDENVVGYGRTEAEAVRNALAARDEGAVLTVTGGPA